MAAACDDGSDFKKDKVKTKQMKNQIEQWSAGEPLFRYFLVKLSQGGVKQFPDNKLDAKKLFDQQESSTNNLIDRFESSRISTSENVETKIEPTNKPRLPKSNPSSSFVSPIPTRRKDSKKKDSKSPMDIERETEKKQRRSGQMVENPTTRLFPINVYCGGGKHCGNQVVYNIETDSFPDFCDGHFEKITNITKKHPIRNHQSNWDEPICVHGRCIIANRHDLIWALEYGCCPNKKCRRELHGGIINNFGLVLH